MNESSKPLSIPDGPLDDEPSQAEVEAAARNWETMPPELKNVVREAQAKAASLVREGAAKQAKALKAQPKTVEDLDPRSRRRLRAKQVKIDAQLRDAGVKNPDS